MILFMVPKVFEPLKFDCIYLVMKMILSGAVVIKLNTSCQKYCKYSKTSVVSFTKAISNSFLSP